MTSTEIIGVAAALLVIALFLYGTQKRSVRNLGEQLHKLSLDLVSMANAIIDQHQADKALTHELIKELPAKTLAAVEGTNTGISRPSTAELEEHLLSTLDQRMEPLQSTLHTLLSTSQSLPTALSEMLNDAAGQMRDQTSLVCQQALTQIGNIEGNTRQQLQGDLVRVMDEIGALRAQLDSATRVAVDRTTDADDTEVTWPKDLLMHQLARRVSEMRDELDQVNVMCSQVVEAMEREIMDDPLYLAQQRLAACLQAKLPKERYRLRAEVAGDSEKVPALLQLAVEAGNAPSILPIYLSRSSVDFEKEFATLSTGDDHDRALQAARNKWSERLREEAEHARMHAIRSGATAGFALLFLPSEVLYAEALSETGLVDSLADAHSVLIASPTTLTALIGSLDQQATFVEKSRHARAT